MPDDDINQPQPTICSSCGRTSGKCAIPFGQQKPPGCLDNNPSVPLSGSLYGDEQPTEPDDE